MVCLWISLDNRYKILALFLLAEFFAKFPNRSLYALSTVIWPNCLQRLERELSDQQLNTWIRPLQVVEESSQITLMAPNRFVLDWVKQNFKEQIETIINEIRPDNAINLLITIGSQRIPEEEKPVNTVTSNAPSFSFNHKQEAVKFQKDIEHNLNPSFSFDNFVEGKSNQLARAASMQVAENPGQAYNPLFLYGGVGLGKLI